MAELMVGGEKTAQATTSTNDSCNKIHHESLGDGASDQDSQQKPVLMLTPQQLLGMLDLCGGDQDKLVELIQELTGSGGVQSQETVEQSNSASAPAASLDSEVAEPDVPEQNETPEQQLEESEETDCKVQ